MLLTISEHKQTINQIRFQDPIFNRVDRAFLEETDIRKRHILINSPESERSINNQTFLYTPTLPVVTYSCLSVPSPSDLWINYQYVAMISMADMGEPREPQSHTLCRISFLGSLIDTQVFDRQPTALDRSLRRETCGDALLAKMDSRLSRPYE